MRPNHNESSEIWLLVGSQHLYGPETLEKVADNARAMTAELGRSLGSQIRLVLKPVLTDADGITTICHEANGSPNCAAVILWMHTFSPAKMWIHGLKELHKPMLHLHTQFHLELPSETIDMDFMNLNQSAHGDREAGYVHSRLRKDRKIVAGHWRDAKVVHELARWCRVATAWHEWQSCRICRFGDNMRSVAVTEGDKVAAQARFGFRVDGYGVGDLVEAIRAAPDAQVSQCVEEICVTYEVDPTLLTGGPKADSLLDSARIECGLSEFLAENSYDGFTTTFEDLHGLRQLPGLAVQRLMARGYGFGAEGDWKTAALLSLCKRAEEPSKSGTSFMEDYTYHLVPGEEAVLGAHMLEICPSIAEGKPRVEIHPLGIGGKDDPVRLVFDARPGPAINVTLVDLGARFRFVVNKVEAISPPPLPRLPVARAFWKPSPDFATATASWILCGGAHHTVFSYSLCIEDVLDLARIAGVECQVIDERTEFDQLEKELRWNEVYYHLAAGFSSY